MTDRSELAFWIALGALAGGIIGIIGTIATAGLLASDFPSRWYTLVPDHAPIPVAFSDEVVLESDIVPPDVTEVSGKAKFLSDSSQRLGHAALGYVISVAANSLDQSTLPEKYKKEINLEGQNYLPLREATYEVYFTLRLLDRDGFELFAVRSAKHNIESGTTTQIQANTEPLITRKLANLTDKMSFIMIVDKCLSATKE